jgi:transposase
MVTFEEGISAAWLYNLLKPHVTKLVVCDPRKNASMREGNQNDKIDARRLAELLRLNHLQPRLSRGTRPTKPEGIGAQLSHHHQRSRTGHVAGEGDLSQLGHSL